MGHCQRECNRRRSTHGRPCRSRRIPSPELRPRPRFLLTELRRLADNPRPPGCRKLTGQDDAWRIRVGDYRIVPITEAKNHLSEFVRESADRYESLIEDDQDTLDRLSIYETAGEPTIRLDEAKAQLAASS